MAGGRPKKIAPPPRSLVDLTSAQVAEIAPLNKDGAPDCMNYMPTRNIPLSEATQRGWPTFFEGVPCRYGHVAPRYVSNPSVCVDCFRIKRGKTPIGQKAGGTAEYTPRNYTQRAEQTPTATVVTSAPIEPDRYEKLFLSAYAGTKDIDAAARQASMTEAQVMARMSYSEVFRNAVNALEERLQIRRTPTPTGPFDWTDDKRKWLIEVYIDTGDIATARDAIRVTPSEYFRELERNIEFSDAVLVATPLALNALEERAHQLALAGNDKLLQKILAAKRPGEYGERIKVDMSVTEKLTDAQLDAQLTRLVSKQRGRIFDGEFTEVDEPQRQIEDARDVEGAGPPQAAEPNSDLL
jgi:hypothetical protein